MMYYLLRNVEARIGRFQSAVDSQGRAITRYDAATALALGNTSAAMTEHAWVTTSVKGPLPDVISMVGQYLLLSPRAKIVWNRLVHDPTMGFLPTTIVNRRGNRVLDYDYEMAWISTPRDVLDYERSECTYSRVQPTMVLTVNTYVLAQGNLPNWDFVLTKQLDWLVTQKLVTLFSAAGISGCKFDQVTTSRANEVWQGCVAPAIHLEK